MGDVGRVLLAMRDSSGRGLSVKRFLSLEATMDWSSENWTFRLLSWDQLSWREAD